MPSEIARKLEKLSIVRSRVRKGNPWLKEETTEDGEQVIGTNSLQWNAPILLVLLEHYGLRMQLIPELTKRVLLHKLFLFYNIDIYQQNLLVFFCIVKRIILWIGFPGEGAVQVALLHPG